MNTRSALAFLAILVAGCGGGPDLHEPPDIDLSTARELESEGRIPEAVVEYARHVAELKESGRTDVRANIAWGRILGALHRLKIAEIVPQFPEDVRRACATLEPWCFREGPAILSAGAAGRWSQVLALGADPPLLAEAAGAISDLMSEKVENAALRRGKLEPADDISERLYRISLLTVATDGARYAHARAVPRSKMMRDRAMQRLRDLARELRALASLPGIAPGPAARWAERADQADDEALALRRQHSESVEPPTNEVRQSVEVDTNGLLKAASEDMNRANDLLSRRADEGEILEALERALRNFVAARECLVEPSPIQKRTLDVMAIAADELRGLAFAR